MLAGNRLKSFPDASSQKTMTLVATLKSALNFGKLPYLSKIVQQPKLHFLNLTALWQSEQNITYNATECNPSWVERRNNQELSDQAPLI